MRVDDAMRQAADEHRLRQLRENRMSVPGARFDLASLSKLAARFRTEDSLSATAAAFHGTSDLTRQPKLNFKAFEVRACTLGLSPDCSYRLLSEALSGAKHSITAYVYNISAQWIRDALRERAKAGVKVQVMVDANDPSDAANGELKKLKALGIDVALAPSTGPRKVFTVCHQKYAVIDGKVTVVGSGNWAGTAFPEATQPGQFRAGNREWIARIDDAAVAAWFQRLFDLDWAIPATSGLAAAAPLALSPALEMLARYTSPGQIFDVYAAKSSVRLLPLVSPVNYLAEVKGLIGSAKRRVWIQQQYIKAGDGVNELLEAVHARSADCEIRIVVSPKFVKSWEDTLKTLRAAGLVKYLRAQNLEHVVHCHNKGVIVDAACVVSSTNWSENSITRAREAGLLMKSPEVTDYFAAALDLDWTEGLTPRQVAKTMIAASPSDFV